MSQVQSIADVSHILRKARFEDVVAELGKKPKLEDEREGREDDEWAAGADALFALFGGEPGDGRLKVEEGVEAGEDAAVVRVVLAREVEEREEEEERVECAAARECEEAVREGEEAVRTR